MPSRRSKRIKDKKLEKLSTAATSSTSTQDGLESVQPKKLQNQEMHAIDLLPAEIWCLIFDCLTLTDRLRFRKVCKLFYHLKLNPTLSLVVPICCATPPIQYIYDKSDDGCIGVLKPDFNHKSSRNPDYLYTNNLHSLLSSLPNLCPFLTKLKLVLLNSVLQDCELDVKLLPPVRSLEIHVKELELINQDIVQMKSVKSFTLKESTMRNLPYTFPNIVSLKIDFSGFNFFDDQLSNVRKLTVFGWYHHLQMRDPPKPLFLQKVESLKTTFSDLFQWLISCNLERLRCVDFYLEDRWMKLDQVMKLVETLVGGDFFKAKVFLNNVRFLTYDQIPEIREQEFQNILCRRFKSWTKLFYGCNGGDRNFGNYLDINKNVHIFNVNGNLLQSQCDAFVANWPHLVQLNISVPFTKTVKTSRFIYDFSFLLKLTCLQSLELRSLRSKNPEILVQVIRDLPHLSVMKLINVKNISTLVKEFDQAVFEKHAKSADIAFTLTINSFMYEY